jgi:hypothetical protein
LNLGRFDCFTFTFCSFGESRLLVSWCAGVAWRAMTSIVTGVGDLVKRTGNGRIGRVLGDRAIEMSGSIVCDQHCACEGEECEFLG